jgi:hypothetical protein
MFENHPGCWIIQGCELQFPGLHAHVTWFLSIFSVGIFENQGLGQYSHY